MREVAVKELIPRRIKVIDNVFQLRLIAVLLTVVIGGLAALAIAVLIVSLLVTGWTPPVFHSLYVVLPAVLVNDLAIMVILIVVGIGVTHRIAGPVYRVQRDIDRVLAGEKGVRVRFRKGDSFPELAEKVNQLIERCDRASRR